MELVETKVFNVKIFFARGVVAGLVLDTVFLLFSVPYNI
jgi:hypothetical protein